MCQYVRLDEWARSLLVDPLSKTPFREAADSLVSDYEKRYPLVGGAVYDLRLLRGATVATDLRA
jgi:hypothetical protein